MSGPPKSAGGGTRAPASSGSSRERESRPRASPPACRLASPRRRARRDAGVRGLAELLGRGGGELALEERDGGMLGIERPHLVESRARLGRALGLEGPDGPLPRDLELRRGILLLARLLEDLRRVLIPRKDLQHLLGSGEGGVEIAGVVALRGADEQPVRLDRSHALLARRRGGNDQLQGRHVDARRRVLRLLHQLPGGSETRIHLQDEIAPDQAVVDLAFLEEIQGVTERRKDLLADLPGQGGITGVRPRIRPDCSSRDPRGRRGETGFRLHVAGDYKLPITNFLMRTIIECVPNISEGRESAAIKEIAAAVRGAGGVRLLDVSSDPAHNRSVLTFVGDVPALRAGCAGPVRGGARPDRPPAPRRRASAHGSGGRRPVHPDPRRLHGGLRRAVEGGRRGDRRALRRSRIPLRGIGLLGGPAQPRRDPQGTVRGLRREDAGPALGPGFRPASAAPVGRRRGRRRPPVPDRVQHQPRHGRPGDRRSDRQGRSATFPAGFVTSRRWGSRSPTAASSRSRST